MGLCWNVLTLTHCGNSKVEFYNIFNHWKFLEECIHNAVIATDKISFAAAVHSDLRYYFWSKFEWEILVKGFFDRDEEKKIDVYDQVNANFDQFVDYLWDRREYLKTLSFRKDENK